MAEKRKDTFKRTGEVTSGTERRRTTTDLLRKDKRSKAVQHKRRKIIEELEGDGTAMPVMPAYSTTMVQEAVMKFKSSLPEAVTGSTPLLLESTRQIRGLLCMEEPPIDQLIAAGLVPDLVKLLCSSTVDEDLKLEVIWCLTNVAAGSHEQTREVLTAGPYIITFILPGASDKLKEQACWVLGNIAADCDEFRHTLQAQGAVVPLVRILREAATVPLKRQAAWALSSLAKGASTPVKPFFDAGLFDVLNQIICAQNVHEELLKEAAWILAFLTTREDEYIRLLLDMGIVAPLVRLLARICQGGGDQAVALPVLRVLANIISAPDPAWTELVVQEPDIVPTFLHLLSAPMENRALVKETLWTLSNVANSHPTLITSTRLLQLVLQYLHSDQFDIKREALFVILHVTAADPRHLQQIQQMDDLLVRTLLELLQAPDVEVVGGALHVLVTMVDHLPGTSHRIIDLDGVETIENLQYAPISDEAIRIKAGRLAEDLIKEEEEEEMQHDHAVQPPAAFEFCPPSQGSPGVGRGRQMTLPAWQTMGGAH